MGINAFQKITSRVYQWQGSTSTYFYSTTITKQTISLSESFQDTKGSYIFLNKPVTNMFRFKEMLADTPYRDRFLWLEDTGEYQIIARIKVPKDKVSTQAKLSMGEYFLLINGMVTKVEIDVSNEMFLFKPLNNTIQFAQFNTPYIENNVNNLVQISLSDGRLHTQIDSTLTTFDDLRAVIGYFIEDREDTAFIKNYFFSFLKNTVGGILFATIDLFRLMEPGRTFFQLQSGQEYESGLLTIYGENIHLKTVDSSKLVFCSYPSNSIQGITTLPYLSFAGDYMVNLDSNSNKLKLLCGLSGMEYLILEDGDIISLVPNQSSYYTKDGFTNVGTTSWFMIPNVGMEYFSKPKQAGLYEYNLQYSIMEYYDIISTVVPVGKPFPMILFGARMYQEDNINREIMDYKLLDDMVLQNRETIILMQNTKDTPVVVEQTLDLTKEENMDMLMDSHLKNTITALGLVASVNTTDSTFEYLGFANTKEVVSIGNIPLPDIGFTRLRDKFLKAFSSNRLFLVMSNDKLIMGIRNEIESQVSIPYSLNLATAKNMKRKELEYQVAIGIVMDYFNLKQLYGTKYTTESLFIDELVKAYPQISTDEINCFLRYCGQLKVNIDGWMFQLSPRNWNAHDSIFICKYTRDYSLYELAQNTNYWVYKEAAAGDGMTPEDTSVRLINILEDAIDKANNSTDTTYTKLATIIQDKTWCGSIAFNVPILIDEVPGEMRSILSGVDKNKFYAHHIGFDLGGITIGESMVLHQTSMFGLIDYENTEDMNQNAESDYGFNTKRLKVLLLNSKVQYFSCLCQLMVNRLFGGAMYKVPLTTGNILNIVGSYQRNTAADNGAIQYSFSLREETEFALDSIPIESILVASARMSLTSGGDESIAAITLSGKMKFFEPVEFDPFGYGDHIDYELSDNDDNVVEEVITQGWLNYRDLVIKMTSQIDSQSFAVIYENMKFDETSSKAREKSLVYRFPIDLKGIVVGNDSMLPADLGFVSVNCPLSQQKMEKEWYGLLWNIDMGSLGAMMKSSSIRMDWLTAWCVPKKVDEEGNHVNPNASSTPGTYQVDPFLFFGVRTPFNSNSLPLQGIMTLGFKSIQFGVSDKENDVEYYIRLRNFGLKLLGISFPPGSSDIYLFANPDQNSSTKLGWYAAYSMGEDNSGGKV